MFSLKKAFLLIGGLFLTVPVQASIIYRPGSLPIEAASGMTSRGASPWTFLATNYDPYTKTIVFPTPFPADEVKTIGIEIEKGAAGPQDQLQIFITLNNGKGITTDQSLIVSLIPGTHRYLFEVDGISWFRGQLTGLRIDPATSPGEVSIKSIGIFDRAFTKTDGDIVIQASEDQKIHLGPGADTFSQANLVRYRLNSGSGDFAILSNYQGIEKVLKIYRPKYNDRSKSLILGFASPSIRIPLSPAIPPYIGLEANHVSIKLWADAAIDLAGLSIEITRGDGPSEVFPIETTSVQAKQWNTFNWSLKKTEDPTAPVINVELRQHSSSSSQEYLYIAQPRLYLNNAKEPYDLLTTKPPLLTTGMRTPLAKKPVRGLPINDSLTLGGVDITQTDIKGRLPILEQFMAHQFPKWDFILAPVWTPPLDLYKELPKLPIGTYFQFQKAKIDSGYLKAIDAMPRNGQGEALEQFGNGVMATHPAIQEALKDQIDYAASLGVNNFKQVDMVWPWQGRWGYDPASITAFREDLSGTDEGLNILPGLAGRLSEGGLIHFWDYYEYYHGFRLQPKDLELKDWSEYLPVSESAAASGSAIDKRNLGVFILLYHYEWLRQAQRFGRWAKAHQGRHDYTLNPEDLGNGGDYIFLVRLADAGIPYIEYFGGPSALQGAYYNLPMYVSSAAKAKRKFGLILEIAQAGHGEHYLAPEINWLYAFELAAGGLRNYHNEWAATLWRAITTEPPKNPELTYDFDRWSSWVSAAFGFTFAREADIRRPKTKVFNISTRSPGYYVSSWIWGLKQGPSFGPLLAEKHINYQQWDRSAMPEILDQADVVFYTPPTGGRTQDWEALRQWLRQSGKSLVTHSNIPFAIDDGQARLAAGVKDVVYTGVDQNYTDFLAKKTDYHQALFPELKAARSLKDGFWSAIPGADILIGSREKPLLSRISVSGGLGKIYYLHCNPLDLNKADRETVTDTLVRLLKLPQAIQSSTAPVMAHRFSSPDFEVVNVWTGLQLPGSRAGYGPHLMPNRGADQFDPKKRPYPYLLPGTDITIEVPVPTAGSYRIYAFLSGEERSIQTSRSGTLSLEVKGASAESFFLIKEGPQAEAELQKLKQQRARLLPYGPDLPRRQETSR